MKVLKVNNLVKRYKEANALNNISMELESGKIYGLIGQNGAGKTTLMRMITGISFPTSGTIELFGESEGKRLESQRKRIGSMVEHPALMPNMSAKDNLKLHRIMRGIPNEEVEREVLDLVGLNENMEDAVLQLVGLTGTESKKARNFSMGMKQRLGIAIALLSNPEFLILDEPINGLDPVGIKEMRELLKKLCEEKGITILISSHNLPELYQVATDYIIMHRGEIKETCTLEELEEKCKQHILIECNKPEKLTTVLETELNTSNYKVMPDKTIKLYDYLDDKDKVARVIYENEILVTTFYEKGDTLEDYFIATIGGNK